MDDIDNIVEATNDNFGGYDEEELAPVEEDLSYNYHASSLYYKLALVALFLSVLFTGIHLATEVAAWGIVALIFAIVLGILGILVWRTG